MEIRPVPIDSIASAADGPQVVITGEVGSVAGDLKEIDANLELRFSEKAGLFLVYCHRPGQRPTGRGDRSRRISSAPTPSSTTGS
jgi:hypothetical protein